MIGLESLKGLLNCNKYIGQRRVHFSNSFWTSISRVLKMDVSVVDDGNKAVISLPALSYHDFDRTGRVNIRNMQKLMTVARFFAYHTPNTDSGLCFMQYDKLTADRYTFMASTRTVFSKELFDFRRRSQPPDLKIAIRLGYVGRSSLNSIAELYCARTGHVFVSNTNQVVMVDKTTRKPTTLPDWWREKFASMVPDGKALVVPLDEVPSDAHKYDVRVPWTDIDAYKHTNYISYIRYCQDAALDAGYAGYFTKVQGDFLEYNVKVMSMSYKGESLANDSLTVHVWENPTNPYEIHFSIEKLGAVIFQNNITLYEPENIVEK